MSRRAPLVRLFEDEAFIDGFAGGGGASTGIEMALAVVAANMHVPVRRAVA